MTEEMRRDDRIFLIGEEVAQYNGAYKVSQGMLEESGSNRIDTPIAEGGFAGLGVGAAMAGMRPIVEFDLNFPVAYDHLINSAAKNFQCLAVSTMCRWSFAARMAPLKNPGSQHSTAVTVCTPTSCLKVLTYCDAAGAYGLLKAAIREDNPVVFLERNSPTVSKGKSQMRNTSFPLTGPHSTARL